MIRQEQCDKVCRIIDNYIANRPTERDSLIVAVQKAFNALEKQRWIPVTETPPRGRDLMLKIHDVCNSFFYYHMGFHDGEKYFTYNFLWQRDKDLEIVGWQLCPWEER